MPHRTAWKLALVVFLLSLPLKLLMARNLPWEIDYVPLIWRGWQFLQGGAFPAVGTLSSVAAYNMPSLVWMHLPALALTHQAGLSMLLTMLAWNALTTAYLYALGRSLFRPAVGLLAVLIFSFSPSGLSSAYTSWAQLLLPGFYAMTLYHLWQWARTGHALHLTLCGVIAMIAFMTHFSAVVLFPTLLIAAVLLRARWSVRGVAVGAVICGLLIAPYLAFESGRSFADLRAFTSRTKQIAPEILAQYERYKDKDEPAATVTEPVSPGQTNPTAAPQTAPQPQPTVSLQERLTYRLHETWLQVATVLAYPATQEFYTAREAVPLFYAVPALMAISLWAGVLWAVYRTGRLIWRSGRRNAWAFWQESDAGRALLVAGFGLMTAAIMIGLKSGQYTYYMGLLSLIAVLIAYAWMELWRYRAIIGRVVIVGCVALWLTANVADRLMEMQQHNDAIFSAFNSSLYRHVEAATNLIALDWGRSGDITVSYDLLPEMPDLWWLPAWGSVDPLYRMGAPYDVLLAINHNLTNTNTTPLGIVEKADYVVVYSPGLSRYDANTYQEVGRAGTTVILKPIVK